MTDLQLIISISLIHLGAVMSPGPDFIMVVKNSLNYSRKTGVVTALGIGTGIIIHIVYTFFGIGLIISQSPSLFNILKIIGALYIVYLGVMSFNSKSSQNKVVLANETQEISSFKAFRIGFVTNALNVKASMFFLGLFSTMITPDTNKNILLFLGFLIVFQTTLWFVLVAYFFTQLKIQKKYYQYENIINKTFGVLLILLAIKILFF